MIVLHELVQYVLTEIGHLLVPIDVFGFTYPRLEQLMVTTMNKFQEYRPMHKKVPVSVNTTIVIPDASRVISVRFFAQQSMWEYVTAQDFQDWDWDKPTRTFSVVTAGDYFIEYLGNYTVEFGKSISFVSNQLFPEEINISLPLQGHFKKGTLTVTLDEGVILPEVFIVDTLTDTLTIPIGSKLFSKLTTGSIVTLTSNTILPTPLLSSYSYYIIKNSTNNTFQLALTSIDTLLIPKIFTTNFISNPTYLTIPNHGLSTNQSVQLSSTGTLPNTLLSNTTYYVNVVNSNIVELKITTLGTPNQLSTNGFGTHSLVTGFVDLTDIGTGIHMMTKQPFTMKEDMSSYNINNKYITLSGTLGDAVVGLDSTDVTVGSTVYSLNTLDLLIHTIKAKFVNASNLVITFNSQYKTIKELSLQDNLYVNLFKGELMKGLGTSKAITKLDGLPFDVSVDDLFSKGDDLVNKTLDELMSNRSRWYLFR